MKTRGIEKSLETDLLKLPNLLFFIVIFVLSRIWLLDLGFGLDADAWRVANSAFDLRYHGIYHASRFPGYPLPEFFNAFIIGSGWLATNGLTMLLSLVSVIVFAQILKIYNCRMRGLLTMTYAFLPLLWINSTNTMDYTWSVTFIMLTWLLLLRKKAIIAGLMMGLAIGSRPQSIFIMIPFLFLIHGQGLGTKGLLRFLLAAVISSICLFSPLFFTYGLTFIQRYPAQTTVLQIGYGMLKHFGLPAVITGFILLFTSLRGLRSIVAERGTSDIFVLLSLAVLLVSFAALPYHIEYLIPAIPFGLIFFERISKKSVFLVFCGLLVLHAFVTIGGIRYVGDGRMEARILTRGAISQNAVARKQQLHFMQGLMQANIEEHSVVIVGPCLPILSYLDGDVSSTREAKMMYDSNLSGEGVCNFQRDVCYRYLLALHELEALLRDDYKIYYIEGIREFTIDVHGYDLRAYQTTYLATQAFLPDP